MPADQSYIDALARRPQESLQIELKTWIDPETPEGAAKIVRTCIALRNNNGGFLLIGFNNETGQPDLPVPANVEQKFHIDRIQGLITKHSSEPFAVDVRWAQLVESLHPIIEISAGVTYPVAAKAPLFAADGRPLVQEHRVYVRSLQSNNTAATTEATYRDWPAVVDLCFENREADIGRFLRRHLSGITPDVIRELAATFQSAQAPTPPELALSTLQDASERFSNRLAAEHAELLARGKNEAAFVIESPVEFKANTQFLNLLMSSNPKYTGWPLFIDSRYAQDSSRPEVVDGAWQVFIVSLGSGFGDEADFWRAAPTGCFYHGRILQDDMSESAAGIKPCTVLDFGLAILRCTEAILLGLDFAGAMETPEGSVVNYAFRWTRLKGRMLSSWAQRDRRILSGQFAHQDEVISELAVPVGTSKSAIAEHVHAATAPLFDVFGGAKFEIVVIMQFIEMLRARNF